MRFLLGVAVAIGLATLGWRLGGQYLGASGSQMGALAGAACGLLILVVLLYPSRPRV